MTTVNQQKASIGVFICFFDKIKGAILKGERGLGVWEAPHGVKNILRIRWAIIFPPVLQQFLVSWFFRLLGLSGLFG